LSRPSFQFYPSDWRNDANLRRCSPAARGAWMDVLCTLHDSETYGLVRWPLKELANAAGVPLALLRELTAKQVLRGCDSGQCEPFTYVPRSGRRSGPSVILVAQQDGPVWYSRRLVKDEHLRSTRGSDERFGDSPEHPPDNSPKPPIGEGNGDGSSSSSSSSPSGLNTSTSDEVDRARPAASTPHLALVEAPQKGPPDCPHVAILALWREVLPALPQHEACHWNGARADHLRARWRETAVAKRWATQAQGLEYFRRLFAFVGRSAFLTGKAQSKDRRPFVIELAWLAKPENWAKVHEGKYHPTSEETA
jgi:hypothetical protein